MSVSDQSTASNTTKASLHRKSKTFFSKSFIPRDTDVIIGKGMKCYNHPGNRMLRRIIKSHLHDYASATCKKEKSDVLSSIVDEVQKNGSFVKRDNETSLWFEADDFLARDKTSQAIRKIIFLDSRSSKSGSSMKKIKSDPLPLTSHHKDQYKRRHDWSSKHGKRRFSDMNTFSDPIDLKRLSSSFPPQLLNDENPYEPVPISEIFNTGYGTLGTRNSSYGSACRRSWNHRNSEDCFEPIPLHSDNFYA